MNMGPSPSQSPSTDSCSRSSKDKFHMIFIELSALFSVAALLVLVVLGSYRRRSSNEAVRTIIWVAYAACIPMVSYTMGMMQWYPCKNSLFSVWAVCFVLFLGSSDSLSAYSLQDNADWKKFYSQQLIQLFFLGLLVGDAFMDSDFSVPIWAMFVLTMLKSGTRLMSFKLASRDCMLSESTKWVDDYMSYEHELCAAPGDRDPVTMRGYRYVVAGGPKKKPKVKAPEYLLRYDDDHLAKLVTVDKVWGCDGSFLRGSSGGERLKDLCLSMAPSKMLNRRFAGLELAESNLDRTSDFLFRGLLHEDGDDNWCDRAFRVIEEELAFVHDYFYTKYFAIYSHARRDIKLSFFMIPFCIWLACKLFHHFLKPGDDLKISVLFANNSRNYDALLTFVIAIGITLFECFQVFFYLTSSWCKVALISKYVVRDSWNSRRWVAKLIGCITSLRSFRCWERRLGQYTLLKDFDYKPMNLVHYATFYLSDKTKTGRKQGNPVELSMDTKQALMETLKRSNGRLTNGVTSLRASDVEHRLSWSCTTLPTTTHTILAWHIATTLAHDDDNRVDGDRQRGGGKTRCQLSEQDKEIGRLSSVACSLSKYMAYLVVFVPDLLPDHSFVSESIVDAMVDEAGDLLKGEKKRLRNRCRKLMEKVAEAEPDDSRLVIVGARLASQLMVEIQDPVQRWKVVSDFWAESTVG